MLIVVEYKTRRDFKRSVCNYRDNWNRHHKAPDDDDIGLREAFHRICVKMYGWALDLFQTLPNYQGQRAIICYSFVCLADNIGQLLQTNRPDRSPISAGMRSRALRCAVPAMQELKGERKDFLGASHYLMTIFEGVQHQQTVKGVLPHTEVESERYIAEQRTILKALREHADMKQSVKGYPSPVSLREGRSLVLPLELYDALYSPRPMVPPARSVGSPWKGVYGKDDRSSTQLAPFDTAAPVPGGAAAMMRMDNRVTTFAETQEGSAKEWESETETTAPITGMRPVGMSDEDWKKGDLDLGYHPTSEVADVPPVMDDREIEGAQSALPPDSCLQEDADMHTKMTEGITQYPPADEIIKAESCYGNPEADDETFATDDDDDGAEGNDYDVVIEETYYKRGEEELDYHDDAAVGEDMPAQDEGSRPVDEDEDVNADDEEEDDPAVNESVRPKKGKDAPVCGRLGTPVGDRSTTDTETGETAELMESVVLGSPDGDPTNEESPPRRRSWSDRESTVLSDNDRRSRGHSSDSSRSSCRSAGSKHRWDRKEKPLPESKGSSQLNPPETTTPPPRQSPQSEADQDDGVQPSTHHCDPHDEFCHPDGRDAGSGPDVCPPK